MPTRRRSVAAVRVSHASATTNPQSGQALFALLSGEHASLPVNPLLANPVYLAGYIEQVGTGTNDVIDRCLELGLRKPEFRQDEGFMVTLWRREGSGTVQGDPEVIQSDPKLIQICWTPFMI